MATRSIRTDGEEILRKVCRPVGEVTDRVRENLADMLETMKLEQGVGIAAPQVGIMRRMFIAMPDLEGEPYYMIDPKIISEEGETVDDEGCLSVPGYVGTVKRPQKIVIEATNLDGERKTYTFEDFGARVMCHENDHLNGILYTDIATNIRTLEEAAEEAEKEAKEAEEAAEEAANETKESESADNAIRTAESRNHSSPEVCQ